MDSRIGDGLDIFGESASARRPRRFRLVACEVAHRECCFAAAVSPNVIDLHFLTQGLHDVQNTSMRDRVQQAIDEGPTGRHEAILLGYGLCNGGLAGVQARDVPLVLPRAHDCITLFLGSKERYQESFDANPGTYYLSTGWCERDRENLENMMPREDNQLRRMGLDRNYQQFVELYGEENAQLIMDSIGGMRHYARIGYIDMGIASAAEQVVQAAAGEEAARRGWTFERMSGKLDLFLKLTAGDWDESRFLIVPPGHHIEQAHDGSIVKAVG